MRRRWQIVSSFLAVVLIAAACTSKSGGDSAKPGEPAMADGDTVPFTLMEFNIEYGGKGVDFNSVPKAIELADPDVVAVEEAFGQIPKIADALGWEYTDERRQLISRYPLLPPPDGDPNFTYIELQPGKVVAVANIHLTSSPYGPNIIERKDAALKEVIATENKNRMDEIEPVVETMSALADAGTPSFIMGDFNTPSHHDWTKEMVGARPQILFPVEWPVTKLVEDAGFKDSYRTLYPDPVENPGLTWPAWRPAVKNPNGWNPVKGETLEDRIDLIFSGGPAEPAESYIMGEEGADVAKSVTPWPTDHRAVISTFDVSLVDVPPPPDLVAFDDQLVDLGTPVSVTYNGDGASMVTIVPVDPDALAEAPIAEEPVTASSGTVDVDTRGLNPEPHVVQLLAEDGSVLASAPIWLQEAGAEPIVATEKPVYRSGEPIKVTWYGAPANRWDWIGFYERNASPGAYMQWQYTRATVAGEAIISKTSPGPWPLAPGKYSVYLLLDDGYKIAATNEFEVK